MESFIYKKSINPQIYKWCINKHPFINSQIIYEQNLKKRKKNNL